jgi:hypothetical protein
MPNVFPRVFKDEYNRSIEIGFTRNPREVYVRFREGSDPAHGTFWSPEMSYVVGQSIIDAGKTLGFTSANEIQAKAAYEQFAEEPEPNGFKQTYEPWEELDDATRQLWFRVATASLNGKRVSEL